MSSETDRNEEEQADESRAANDDRGAGRARAQPQEHLAGDPARPSDRRHRALGLGQVEPGVRHHLRRGTAALHGVAVELRQAIRRPGGEARRGFRVRPVAGDLDRAEDDRQQPALDRRHDDGHRQLPEPVVRDDRPAALPAHRRADAEPDARARSSRPSCRCRKERRSSCGRRCSGSTARSWISSSPSCGRRAAGGCSSTASRWTSPREVDLDESKVRDMDAVVDRFVVGRNHEKAIKAGIAAALLVGDGLIQVHVIEGASKADVRTLLQGAVQPHAPLRLWRDRARVLHVQQSGERLPDLRRPGHLQDHPSGAAGARPEAEHPGRLLRARGVQVQPGHVGRPADVQPVEDAGDLAGRAVGEAPRIGPRRDPLRHRLEEADRWRYRPTRRSSATTGRPRRSGSAESRGGSNGNTAATASAAKPTRAWKSGWTR